MLQFFMYVTLVVGFIYVMHQGFLYMKDSCAPKIHKNMYDTQIKKYQEIMQEIQEEQLRQTEALQNKIDMEEDILAFVDSQTN